MLRWFPSFQVATTCFSCSPPDLNFLVTFFHICVHVKLPLLLGDNPIAVNNNNNYYYYYYVIRQFIVIEEAELKNNRMKTRQNLYYDQFVPLREQQNCCDEKKPFGDRSFGTWLQPTLRTAHIPPVIQFAEC